MKHHCPLVENGLFALISAGLGTLALFFFLFKYHMNSYQLFQFLWECAYKLKRLVDLNLSVALKKISSVTLRSSFHFIRRRAERQKTEQNNQPTTTKINTTTKKLDTHQKILINFFSLLQFSQQTSKSFFGNYAALVYQQAHLSDGFHSSSFLMTHQQNAFLHISLSLWQISQNVNVKVGHIYMSPLMLIAIPVPYSLRNVINHLEYD